MKLVLSLASLVLVLMMANVSFAKGDYVDVAVDDPQFMQCIKYVKGKYDGGDAASPIAGQSKAVAYCECMWQETPEDFKGNIAKFGETEKGKKIDKVCAKYSNWE